MTRKRTPPAGKKADSQPGSDALRALLSYFATNATAGQDGAKAAQAALDSLAAGNAEQAVRAAVEAMFVYCRIETRAAELDCTGDLDDIFIENIQDLEARLKSEAKRAINKPRVKAAEARKRTFGPKLDKAIERYTQLRNQRGDKQDPSDFSLRRKAAKDAGIAERTLRKHLPAYLK